LFRGLEGSKFSFQKDNSLHDICARIGSLIPPFLIDFLGVCPRRRKVIIILSKEHELIGQFLSYDELFEHLAGIADTEFMAVNHNAKDRDWRFIIHSPRRVTAFLSHLKDSCDAIKEALEESLPLIEICSGDYSKPLYIAQTPNVDMDYLKRRWCIDWCNIHHFLIREL
jgi:hypothetical protein